MLPAFFYLRGWECLQVRIIISAGLRNLDCKVWKHYENNVPKGFFRIMQKPIPENT